MGDLGGGGGGVLVLINGGVPRPLPGDGMTGGLGGTVIALGLNGDPEAGEKAATMLVIA